MLRADPIRPSKTLRNATSRNGNLDPPDRIVSPPKPPSSRRADCLSPRSPLLDRHPATHPRRLSLGASPTSQQSPLVTSKNCASCEVCIFSGCKSCRAAQQSNLEFSARVLATLGVGGQEMAKAGHENRGDTTGSNGVTDGWSTIQAVCAY